MIFCPVLYVFTFIYTYRLYNTTSYMSILNAFVILFSITTAKIVI